MPVVDSRVEELIKRRAKILAQVGDEGTFRERGRQYLLSEAELAVYDELRMLDFLNHNEPK